MSSSDSLLASSVLCASSKSDLNILRSSKKLPEFVVLENIINLNIQRLEAMYHEYATKALLDDKFKLPALVLKGKLSTLNELKEIFN